LFLKQVKREKENFIALTKQARYLPYSFICCWPETLAIISNSVLYTSLHNIFIKLNELNYSIN